MAWKRCDDIDGTVDDVQPVSIGYGGKIYLVHLGPANRDRLDKEISAWLVEAQVAGVMPKVDDALPARTGQPEKKPVHPAKKIRTSKGSRSMSRPDSTEIRAWAATQGIQLKSVGRIPGTIIEQYERAQAQGGYE